MSAGVAGASGRLSFGIRQVAWSSGGVVGGELSAQRVALELEAMGIVDDAVEDGVGDGRLADDCVPAVDRYLAIAQRRTSPELAG